MHLQLLKVKEDSKQLDALADKYEKRFGRRPSRMSELVGAGLLLRVPTDPVGYAYIFSEEGKAKLNLDSPLREKQLLLERWQ
jgi:hypothetical protein